MRGAAGGESGREREEGAGDQTKAGSGRKSHDIMFKRGQAAP